MKAIVKRETEKAIQAELFYTSKVSGKQMRCITWLPKSMVIVEGDVAEGAEIVIEGKTDWFLDAKIREANSQMASENMDRIARGEARHIYPSDMPEWRKKW